MTRMFLVALKDGAGLAFALQWPRILISNQVPRLLTHQCINTREYIATQFTITPDKLRKMNRLTQVLPSTGDESWFTRWERCQ